MSRPGLPLLAVLYAAGLALLVLAFVLLLPAPLRGPVGYLDLAVASAVYSLNFPLLTLVWTRRGSGESRFPMLAVRWWVTALYSPAAIALGVIGAIYFFPFRFQLIGQLALLFLVGLGFAMATITGTHVERVTQAEGDLKASLSELRAMAGEVDDAFVLLGPEWHPHREILRRFRDDLRFLSPHSGARETDLEARLTAELRGIRILLQARDLQPQRADLDARLATCTSLLSLRKQPSIRQGDSR